MRGRFEGMGQVRAGGGGMRSETPGQHGREPPVQAARRMAVSTRLPRPDLQAATRDGDRILLRCGTHNGMG